jgi:hypothetical protein
MASAHRLRPARSTGIVSMISHAIPKKLALAFERPLSGAELAWTSVCRACAHNRLSEANCFPDQQFQITAASPVIVYRRS